jgi:hypothetical protein
MKMRCLGKYMDLKMMKEEGNGGYYIMRNFIKSIKFS